MRNNREELPGARRHGCNKYYTSERIFILNKLFISVLRLNLQMKTYSFVSRETRKHVSGILFGNDISF
jgi:hypothetical protein